VIDTCFGFSDGYPYFSPFFSLISYHNTSHDQSRNPTQTQAQMETVPALLPHHSVHAPLSHAMAHARLPSLGPFPKATADWSAGWSEAGHGRVGAAYIGLEQRRKRVASHAAAEANGRNAGDELCGKEACTMGPFNLLAPRVVLRGTVCIAILVM
jgi:hypothetical protein